jgi:hypothetical protein
MSFYRRNAIITAKKETTYGVDAAPTGADAIAVRNLSIKPQQAEFASRDLIRPYYGNSEQLPTAISVQVEYEIEIAGAGGAGTPPKWGRMLCACAFAETVTAGTKVDYTPVSTNFDSLTQVYSLGGDGGTRIQHKITGSRGTVSFEINAKGIPVMKYRFQGLYSAVIDSAAALVPDFSAFQTPLPSNSVNTPIFSLHGVTAPLSKFSVDVANSLVYRALIGGESIKLTDRKPAGSATFEATTVAVKDWWTIARTAQLGALQIVQGTVAGNIVELNSSRVQISDPDYVDEDGVAMLQTKLVFVPASVGNDEITITVR